jgi:exosortase family protein XrtF
MNLWKDFKPTILFLLKFFVIYLVGNGIYGGFIANYDLDQKLDPITRWVAYQCAGTANIMGYETEVVENDHLSYEGAYEEQTFDTLFLDAVQGISVEEGCNGINIMILFVAFVVGFGGKWLNMLIFIPAGLLFIHLANLGRLMLLNVLLLEFDGQGFHFFHKYGFTAVLYVAILILWYFWVMRWNGKTAAKQAEQGDD